MGDENNKGDAHNNNRVVKLQPGVTMRSCKECGHLISQAEVDAARFDNDCPCCGKCRLSEFEPVKEK